MTNDRKEARLSIPKSSKMSSGNIRFKIKIVIFAEEYPFLLTLSH